MDIKNCAAIITGGASGMGAATAKLLNQAGAKVALFDINKSAAESIAREINGLAVACDITQAESVETAVQTAAAAQGPARIWINCAGIIKSRRMVNKQGVMPLDEFRQVIEVNLIGTFNLMRIAAASMMALE